MAGAELEAATQKQHRYQEELANSSYTDEIGVAVHGKETWEQMKQVRRIYGPPWEKCRSTKASLGKPNGRRCSGPA